jgi:hypothetical protein
LISIVIPESFFPEVQYTFSILIEEFLGQTCTYSTSSQSEDYSIIIASGKNIVIKNAFFSGYSEKKGYLYNSALPSSIDIWNDRYLNIQDLPVIFGKGNLEESNDQIEVNADLIASAFFMLTRWEEVLDDDLDIHKRCKGANAIASKYNFLHRPIVNEYADVLWTVLLKAGYTGTRKVHTYQSVITHDVDQQYQWPDWYTSIKHLGGDLIKRRDLSLAGVHLKSLYETKIKGHQDPFDQHDYLLNLAEKNNYRAYFNFIISQRSAYDQPLSIRDPRLKTLIDRIESAGHVIGYHPGYSVYLDKKIFNTELAQLQSLVRQDIVSGRQHYLRFKVSETWTLWDQAGMHWESSMGYSDLPGFRCGTCYTYTVFDCKARKKLTVKEKPLILMDATLVYYQTDYLMDAILELKNQCKKHHGEWVTIWHNDLVNHPKLKEFESVILN